MLCPNCNESCRDRPHNSVLMPINSGWCGEMTHYGQWEEWRDHVELLIVCEFDDFWSWLACATVFKKLFVSSSEGVNCTALLQCGTRWHEDKETFKEPHPSATGFFHCQLNESKIEPQIHTLCYLHKHSDCSYHSFSYHGQGVSCLLCGKQKTLPNV